MPELPEVETIRRGAYSTLALLALAHVVGAVLAMVVVKGSDPAEARFGLLIGVLSSQPLLCGWWAAWGAWPRFVWRFPAALACCALLGLPAMIDTGPPEIILMHAMGFGMSLAVFAVARSIGGWAFAAVRPAANRPPLAAKRQFSLRDLLLWTTLLALLLSLVQIILGRGGLGGRDPVLLVIAVVGLAVLWGPAVYSAAEILNPPVDAGRLVVGTAMLLVLIALIVTGFASLVAPLGAEPGKDLWLFCCVSAGAAASVSATALALRAAGYRIVQTTAAVHRP